MRVSILVLPIAFLTASLFACGDDDTSATPSPDGGSGTDGGGGGNDGSSSTDSGSTGDSASGNDSGSNGVIGPGPYSIVYAGTYVGIDARAVADGKATFDGVKLTGFTATGRETEEAPTIGTNTANDAAGGSLYVLGRWAGGKTGGTFNGSTLEYTANNGFLYAIGRPSDPIPSTGMTTYSVDNKTPATESSGTTAPGTITGSLAMNLAGAATKIGFSVTIDIPGNGTYTAATTGGTADPSQSDAELLAAGGPNAPKALFYYNKVGVANAGAACTNNGMCSIGVDGVIVGPNAENVIMSVHWYAGAGGSPKSVSGVIAFKK